MNVPEEILHLLICNKCEAPLSCGPVYLTLHGQSICGRCDPPNQTCVRSAHYELTARLLRFPCRYASFGCTNSLAYSEVPHRHEVICEYQDFKCPEEKLVSCDWTGRLSQLLEHYNLKHRTKILNNPCDLPIDTSEPYFDIYLLLANKYFFLLYIKISTATKQIIVSIQFLGDPEMVTMFKYSVNFQKYDFIVAKPGYVIPRHGIPLEENSLSTTFSSLQEVMGDITGITMNIFIKHTFNDVDTDPSSPNYMKKFYFDPEMIKLVPRICRNHSLGCTFTDVDKKCEKHERYFCQYNQNCPLCLELIPNMTKMSQHWQSMHADIFFDTGELWCAELRDWDVQYCILQCSVLQCTLLCRYKLCWSQFSLAILTPYPKQDLNGVQCEIYINNISSGQADTYKPEVQLSEMDDWAITLPVENSTRELQIQVDFILTSSKN